MLLAAGCSGGSPGATVPAPRAPANAKEAVQIVVHVPTRTGAGAHLRSPRYISPSTQSLTIVVQQGANIVLSETANLTPTSTGCSSTLASTVCTLTLSLAAGSYTATVTTYDQLAGSGNVLSAGQGVPFTVLAGQANHIALTLSGVPAGLFVAPQNTVTSGSMAHGFTLAGMQAQSFLVGALDADGNFIVGAGAPTFGFSTLSGSGWTITNPTSAQPGVFTIAPATTQNSSATLQITATYGDTTCARSGAVCSATFAVKNDLPTLFVAACSTSGCGNGDAVLVYEPPYTGSPTATITSGVDGPIQIARDGDRNLYVSNADAGSITEYAPPYSSGPATTISAVPAFGVSVTSGGEIAVSNLFHVAISSSILASSPIDTLPMYGGGAPPAALDASGDVWLVPDPGVVEDFTPSGFALGSVDVVGTPAALTVGPDGTVYVADPTNIVIAVPPYAATQTYNATGAEAIAYDPSGDAIAAVGSPSEVVVINSTASLLKTITSGVALTTPALLFAPQLVACDDGYDIFVANNAAQTVTIYQPPYTAAPISIPTGYVPQGVLLGS
jgi:hypothetical protein